ncbi:hypothetical protein [Acinetobacter ursingii]|nr:hypothetical protein [Acinetobacter ursingii]MEC6128180.1 hypothetical protein [Acinetobacter ursingii]
MNEPPQKAKAINILPIVIIYLSFFVAFDAYLRPMLDTRQMP